MDNPKSTQNNEQEPKLSNLALAVRAHHQEWVDSLPKNPPEVQFSRRHLRKMAKLCDKMRGGYYHRFTRKTTAVLIAAVLMFSMSLCTFAVIKGVPYIIKEFRDHATYQSSLESDKIVGGTIECGYVPDGFNLTDEHNSDSYCLLSFEDSNGAHFNVFKMQNGDEVGIDNEDSKSTIYTTDTQEYIVYERENGNIQVVWSNESFTYRIDGNIPCDVALMIAETVK